MLKGIVYQVKTSKTTGDVALAVDIPREQRYEAIDYDKEAVVIIKVNVFEKLSKQFDLKLEENNKDNFGKEE